MAWCACLAVLFLSGCSESAKVKRHSSKADTYFDQQDYPAAAIEYLNVVHVQQTNGHALGRLGLIRLHQGNLSQAWELLRAAVPFSPDDLDVRLGLARLSLSLREYNEGAVQLEHVLLKSPTNSDALLLAVEFGTSTNGERRVVERLNQVRNLADSMAGYQTALANLSLKSGETNAALAALNRAMKIDSNFAPALVTLGTIETFLGRIKEAEQHLKTAALLSPKRSPHRLRYADFLLRTGRITEGKDYLNALIDDAPDFLSAKIQLAMLTSTEGKHGEARKLVEFVLGHDPQHYEASLLLGRICLATREGRKAEDVFEKLTQRQPGVAAFHYYLAHAQLQQNKLAAALGSLNRALAINRNFSDAILLKAQIDVRRGESDAAIAPLRQLTNSLPDLTKARLVLADAYRAQGNTAKAVEVYQGFARMYPTNPEPVALIGLLQKQNGKRQEARKAFESATRISPAYLLPLGQLVDLDIEDRNYAAALQRIKVGGDAKAAPAMLNLLRAKVYLAQGKYSDAEKSLNETIAINPEMGIAYDLLAEVFLRSGNLSAAMEKLNQSLVKNPNDARILFLKGVTHHARDEFPAARECYESVLKINPRNHFALNNLAALLLQQKEVAQAFNYAKTARDLEPGDAAIADTMGWIYFHQGKYEAALAMFQESLASRPDNPEVLFHCGMTHYALGNTSPAHAHLARADELQRNGFGKRDFRGSDQITNVLQILQIDSTRPNPNDKKVLETRVSTNPQDGFAQSRLGLVLEAEGRSTEAAERYQLALTHGAKDLNTLTRLAKLYLGPQRKPKEALAVAKQARELAPREASSAILLGKAAFHAGDFSWAQTALLDAIRLNSTNSEPYYYLALTEFANGLINSSISTMKNALLRNPSADMATNAHEFVSISTALQSGGWVDYSPSQINEALKKNPDNLPALFVGALQDRNAGRFQKARTTIESILNPNRFPKFFPGNKELAGLLIREGSYEQAHPHAMKARENMQQDPDVALMLGITSLKRGDATSASRLLEESTRRLPTNGNAFYYLGATYKQLKRPSEAEVALTRAIALGIDSKLAAEARNLLNAP